MQFWKYLQGHLNIVGSLQRCLFFTPPSLATGEWGEGIELQSLRSGLKFHLGIKPLSPLSMSVCETGTVAFHKYLQKSVKHRNGGNR